MNFLKQNIISIGAGIVLLAAIFVYMNFFAPAGSSATLSSGSTEATISQQLLVTLQNLHTIKLDNSIFSDPSFISLTDFGVTIPSENVGRTNPFLPIGGVTAPAPQSDVTVPNLAPAHK